MTEMYELVNGSHHSPELGYFEWWYFHFATLDGLTINVVLHETDIFGLSKSSYVSMSLLLPNQKPQYYHLRYEQGQIQRGIDVLKVSDGSFTEDSKDIN